MYTQNKDRAKIASPVMSEVEIIEILETLFDDTFQDLIRL